MELLQCVNTTGSHNNQPRAYHSEDREIKGRARMVSAGRSATLAGGERRVSLPTGHYSASASPNSSHSGQNGSTFRHYGSSLSLANNTTGELTSRTLRPPSPTTLRKSSTSLPPSAGLPKADQQRSQRPSLPNMRVALESPKLADYLERPRLVNAIPLPSRPVRNELVAAAASAHHAKRYESSSGPAYRNLRLGNFMEDPSMAEEDEIIPDRLRQYYLDTYLNVCDTCESQTHCNPMSPIHRGM